MSYPAQRYLEDDRSCRQECDDCGVVIVTDAGDPTRDCPEEIDYVLPLCVECETRRAYEQELRKERK